jgi:hypothetical protein
MSGGTSKTDSRKTASKTAVLIDPPSAFEPMETWEKHLAVLRGMPRGEERDSALASARRWIQRKRKMETKG